MTSSTGYVLVILLLSCAQTAHALPNRFDIICTPAASAPPNTTDILLKIDTDAGIWCSEKCLSKNHLVLADESELILEDDPLSPGDIFTKRVAYFPKTHILHNETKYSFKEKTLIEYDCAEKQFSGFFPDRSHEPSVLQAYPGPEDYPPEAKRRGVSGRVTAQLKIDATGKLISCNIVASSGSSDLDEGTCQFLRKRGRFLAGRDADGTPVAGEIRKTFNWHM
ncbi:MULTISPECIES: energy transducer TonB [Sphingomonas]|jgi:TonB family protein|uniref:energy transducer TonB n=1 Tax=Sphingomonas TaxID=13687 RepID=UPI001AE34852